MNTPTGFARRCLILFLALFGVALLTAACEGLGGSLPAPDAPANEDTDFVPAVDVTDVPTFDLISPEPILMCTPPACQEGEAYFCEGNCPGGCGTVCVTPIPITGTGSEELPADEASLEAWLVDAWRKNINPAAVRADLRAAGRQRDFNDWLSADLDGDRRDEWIMVLYDNAAEPAPTDSPGDLWIVNGNGVVFRYDPDSLSEEAGAMAPNVVGLGDVNGDHLPDLVTNEVICGAHTCYSNYRIVGFAGDIFADRVKRPTLGEGDIDNMISLSTADVQLTDINQDGLTELLVHGGTIGSVGAGVVRPRTEIWSWDGSAVTLADTQLDSTEFRHHLLYEANDLMASGDLDSALLLYETAINDGALRDDAFMLYSEQETRAAVNQFAAFRLLLIDLLQGDAERAAGRLAWLQGSYSDSAAVQAGEALLSNWAGLEGLEALCNQIGDNLAGVENPTGALINMGYGNPQLTAADYCP